MKKKKKWLLILTVVFFLAGVCVIFYPSASKMINSNRIHNRIEQFDKSVEKMNNLDDEGGNALSENNENSSDNDAPAYDKQLLGKLYADMKIYNENLRKNGQAGLADPFAYEEPSFDLSEYGVYDYIFGYVSAPSIDMELPIYLGANLTNMSYGAAHLSYTSVPIGGEGTNAVIAAHRGVINATMFDNIVYLEKGDDVFITNFWGTLNYKVVDKKIIQPTESNNILIDHDRDLLTLITCHPYGYSDQRYLVICERVK